MTEQARFFRYTMNPENQRRMDEERKLSVLLAVNGQQMQTHMAKILSKTNTFQCVFCHSGKEAWELARKQSFQIMYTDQILEDMPGVDLIGQIKQASSSVYAMMGSGHCSAHDVIEAMQAGATDYIIDITCSELVEQAFARAAKKSVNGNASGAYPSGDEKSFITQDHALLHLLEIAKKVASSTATVMVTGESGTGKELLALFIHSCSGREKNAYVAVNCAALPDHLAESELFGHEKGAFTGAVSRKIGKFEIAHNGTLVLDEVTEMALPLQAKLLRALQEKEIVRIGGNASIPIDTRIIAISNRDLRKAVTMGDFREDLYYRLNVIPLTIPPLRERKGDIPLLAEHFFRRFTGKNKIPMKRISAAAMAKLSERTWPGNVRELENTMERGVLIGDGPELQPGHLLLDYADAPADAMDPLTTGLTVREMEKKLIFDTLNKVDDNRTHAAKMLGISIRTLRNKLNEYRNETATEER